MRAHSVLGEALVRHRARLRQCVIQDRIACGQSKNVRNARTPVVGGFVEGNVFFQPS